MIYQPNQPRLLILTKPVTMNYALDGTSLLDHLKTRLGMDGELIAERAWDSFPAEKIRQLYDEYNTKATQKKYEGCCGLLSGEKGVTFIYIPGERVLSAKAAASWVRKVRKKVIGDTKPQDAAPGSFRSFIQERLPEYDYVGWNYDNGVHCSATANDGLKEGGIFYHDAMWRPEEKPEEKRLTVLKLADFEKMPPEQRYVWQIGAVTGKGIFADERVREYMHRLLKDKSVRPESEAGMRLMSDISLIALNENDL